jgi:ABC-type phosphate transport system substrate-binding protein
MRHLTGTMSRVSASWSVVLVTVLFTVVACPLVVTGERSGASLGVDGIHPMNVVSTTIANTLLKQAHSAYAVDHAVHFSTVAYASASAVQNAYLTGAFDFGIGTSSFTIAQQQATPQYAAYPLIGNAIVPVYNLPDSAGLAQLILPLAVICAIERGVLTNWNDSRIQEANPSLVMPDLGIFVHHLGIPTATNDAIAGMCGK